MNMKQGIAQRLLCRALCLAMMLVMIEVEAFAATTVYGSGVVQPVSQPVVFAQVEASVADILVELGDSIAEGDVLVQLKNDALEQEAADQEYAVFDAQEKVQDERTRERFNYIPRRDPDTGAFVMLGETDEIIYEKYSNELNIRAPMAGRVMAIYVDVGSDALAAYHEHGAVILLSTDGRMKVELSGLEGGVLALDQRVVVKGEGFETEGVVVEIRRRGTEAVIQVNSDKYSMDAPVTVSTLEGKLVSNGILKINKPLGVTAYGGIIREVSTYVGEVVNREDVLAMFTWESEPLYLDNASVLRDYQKAKMMLENTRAKLEKLVITAPCSGRIASIDVALDDDVTDGTKLLTIVEDAGMEVVLKVDELDIIHVQPGQKVTMELHALEEVMLTGTVRKIAPIGNTETSVTRYDVYVALDDVDGRVLGGMNVSGEIYIK